MEHSVGEDADEENAPDMVESVVSFASPEVHQSIIDVCKKRPGDVANSSHVISWLLEQTCYASEQLQYFYLAQEIDFCRWTNVQ